MLEKRNQACRNRNDLLRGHVHVIAVITRNNFRLTLATCHDLTNQTVALAQNRVGLRDGVTVFNVRGHVLDLIRDFTLNHFAVRCFDEAQRIHFCVTCEARDQTNVRAFRRFNRADTTIMGTVNVTDIKACAFSSQTTRSERGNTAFVT